MQEIFTDIHTQLIDADRIPFAMAAIFITALAGIVTGPVAGNANPLIWLFFDKVFGGIGDRLDRLNRARADLFFRGFLLSAFAISIALIVGEAAEYIMRKQPFYGLTEAVLLCVMITSGSVWFALLRLYFALEKKDVGQGAYFAIARSARRNLSISDDFGITRAGMGFAARSFDKGLVAPVFWYLIGGLPAALIYTCLASLSWRFGKDGFSKGFGAVPAALEKLMGFIPGLFSGLIFTLASAIVPEASIQKAIRAWMGGGKNRAIYAQGGLPLNVMAWTLGVSLGGAGQDLTGSAIKSEWVGPEGATAKISHKHLRRTIYMNVIAHILFLAILGGAYLWPEFLGYSPAPPVETPLQE